MLSIESSTNVKINYRVQNGCKTKEEWRTSDWDPVPVSSLVRNYQVQQK